MLKIDMTSFFSAECGLILLLYSIENTGAIYDATGDLLAIAIFLA